MSKFYRRTRGRGRCTGEEYLDTRLYNIINIYIRNLLIASMFHVLMFIFHINTFSGVAKILVMGGHSDDTIVLGPGACPPGNVLKFGSRKRHFLHFEGTFQQNI